MDIARIVFMAGRTGAPPTITATSGGGWHYYGDTFTLGVTVAGTGPFSYQWKRGGVDIAGATASTYTISNASSSDYATFTCTVSNEWGTVTSAGIAVYLENYGEAPYNVSISGGGTYPVSYGAVTLSVSASGTEPITFTWGSGSPAPTGSSYTTGAPLGPGSTTVSCTASNDYGSASDSVTVTWV